MKPSILAILAAVLFLAGCAGTYTPVNECPLLGVDAGDRDCFVDYYGSGGDQGPGAGEGEGEGEDA